MRKQIPFELDIESLTQFATCALITSPLGYLWLGGLELWFPGRQSKNDTEKGAGSSQKSSLNATNTVAKVVIDQTVGGAWNTVLYITTMGMLRGLGYDAIRAEIQEVCVAMIALAETLNRRPTTVANADADAGLLVHHVRRVKILALGIDSQLHRRACKSAATGRQLVWCPMGCLSQSIGWVNHDGDYQIWPG